MRIPELLAPAGSIDTLKAGFDAGADAFYLGVGSFNARMRARNFSIEELQWVVAYAHAYQRRIYVTLNTVIYEHELQDIFSQLQLLLQLQVDGIIVQDLGLASIVRDYFPQLELHASTQMFCHNQQEARFLKEFGFGRIILARELSLNEIRHIQQTVSLEYEVFIHGAMCFSFSGCCLCSEAFYGESGNRGRCRQPCRYVDQNTATNAVNNQLYPFSMGDLAGAAYIPQLREQGIASLKIEGRLKNAQSIFDTVSYYRQLLDQTSGELQLNAIATAGKRPKSAGIQHQYSGHHSDIFAGTNIRHSTTGYFENRDYEQLVRPQHSGALGTLIGTVVELKSTQCLFKSDYPLKKGMRLHLVDDHGRTHFKGILLDFSQQKDGVVSWQLFQKLFFNQQLYVHYLGDNQPKNVLKEIQNELKKIKPYNLAIEVYIQRQELLVHAVVDDNTQFPFCFSLAAKEQQHEHKPNKTAVEKIFLQSADSPFKVLSVTCHIDDGVYLPLKTTKAIRRAFFQQLQDAFEKEQQKQSKLRQLDFTNQQQKHFEAYSQNDCMLLPFAEKNVPLTHFDDIYDTDSMHLRNTTQHAPLPTKALIRLPLFTSCSRVALVQQGIQQLVEKGFTRFIISSWGWTPFFKKFCNLTLLAGEQLYVKNLFSYHLARTAGIDYCYRPQNDETEVMATRLRLPKHTYSIDNRQLTVRSHAEYDSIYYTPRSSKK